MSNDVVGLMRVSLNPAPTHAAGRVGALTAAAVEDELEALGFDRADAREAGLALDELHADPDLSDLLARLVGEVEAARGDPTFPLGIWPPLDDVGPAGRFLYHLLIALEAQATRAYLGSIGVPEDVVASTLASFAHHGAIYRRKYGRVGMDAGWWQLLALRGELLEVGRLQYHRLVVGESPLWPQPWYDDAGADALGEGFRRGDPSIGLHIPDGPGFTDEAIDASLARAREVVGVAWPTDRRRLATCMSWLLDENLAEFLEPGSRILSFQRRFAMVPGGHDDDWDTLEFIFRRPDAALDDLPQETTLQRGIVARLRAGGHWRARVGWFDFDRP